MDQEHSWYLHLFALVRYDIPVDTVCVQNSISVVKVFADRDLADREAKRLSVLNESSEMSVRSASDSL